MVTWYLIFNEPSVSNFMAAPTCYILHVCIRNELFMIVGDIAILLHSGMGIKRALCYNFMAALTCFAGLVVGILLGEMTESTSWVLAFASGMFVYIALVDMVSTTLLCYQYEPSFLFVGHWPTAQTQIKRRKMRRLIRVSTVCLQNVLLEFE